MTAGKCNSRVMAYNFEHIVRTHTHAHTDTYTHVRTHAHTKCTNTHTLTNAHIHPCHKHMGTFMNTNASRTPHNTHTHTHTHTHVIIYQYTVSGMMTRGELVDMIFNEGFTEPRVNPLSSCYVTVKFLPKVFPIYLVSSSLAVWTGRTF